jgi:hypothetical protein
MTFERMTAFYTTVTQYFKAFFRARLGFHFRHGKTPFIFKIRHRAFAKIKAMLKTRNHGFMPLEKTFS